MVVVLGDIIALIIYGLIVAVQKIADGIGRGKKQAAYKSADCYADKYFEGIFFAIFSHGLTGD